MTQPLYLQRSPRVAARRIGDELMIMSATDSSLFSLNETAALLWEAADGVTPLDEIVASRICTMFDVAPAVALEDAKALALELQGKGILRLLPQPAATDDWPEDAS